MVFRSICSFSVIKFARSLGRETLGNSSQRVHSPHAALRHHEILSLSLSRETILVGRGRLPCEWRRDAGMEVQNRKSDRYCEYSDVLL